MKGFRGFFIGFTVILVATISLLILAAGSMRYAKTDAVMLNDIVQTVKENREDLGVLSGKRFDTDLLVFDSDDRRIFASSDKVFAEISVPLDAAAQGMIVLPLSEDEQFLGTVVIPDPAGVSYKSTVVRLSFVTALMAAVFLLFYAFALFTINKNVIKPFRRMKEFAALVAQGKLDEPLTMDRGNLFGAFTESFDIMREELKASREREIALRQREKELIASLSHDLKTPVTGIRAICGVLSVKIEDAYLKAKVENIEQKTEEIDRLLSDLLSSSLDDLGQMQVNVTEETSDILRSLVREHDIYGKVTPWEIPDCILRIDKSRMSQVIGNILSNSYKYADTKIDISAGFSESFLEMRIRDHGEGVDPTETEFLTRKFYRGRKNTAGKEGSGLGLYISEQLMQKMGGTLICISDPDGFEVLLKIPLA